MTDRAKLGLTHEWEIDIRLELSKQTGGRTVCILDDALAWPTQGLMLHFRTEVEKRIRDFEAMECGVSSGHTHKRKSDVLFELS
jgi:NADH dehydrogenase (ubiquinone) flavoprotein 1